ncbi:MAG: nucleotidyltransferase family protein [Planctomycetota bacterium]
MGLSSLVTENRKAILEAARRHGARGVRVFGSAARGTARPGSDLDILVSLEPGRSLLDLVAIKQDLEDLLGCEVDVVTEPSVSPYFRERVLDEAVPL